MPVPAACPEVVWVVMSTMPLLWAAVTAAVWLAEVVVPVPPVAGSVVVLEEPPAPAVFASADTWLSLGYLVLLSSCVCMVFQNLGQAHVPPAQASLLLSLESVFAVVASGEVKIHIEQRYALKDVQQAHRDLEARKTTGSTILTLD